LDIKEHNDSTIKQDFFDFLEERDYSLSYKMPFMLAVIKYINSIGDAKIDDVLAHIMKKCLRIEKQFAGICLPIHLKNLNEKDFSIIRRI